MLKHITRYLCLATLCLLMSRGTKAQFVDYGTDPGNLKWRVADLTHYRLIYPLGCDSLAYRYAQYLEGVFPYEKKTLGEGMKARFPVVLHPMNMLSNGMVAWAPRRMELITTPSNDDGFTDWSKHLAIHESRHVVQTGKVMRGWLKGLYYIVGEQAAGVGSLFLPEWFLEGDAVCTETALSGGGRGRLPEFGMVYRAQILEGGRNYSLNKWFMGSFRDYTGSYYALGYYMTAFARQEYGADIWEKTTSRYVSRWWQIPMFGNALKHYAGVGTDGLYKGTFEYLRREWEKADSTYCAPKFLSPTPKRYTTYRYPQVMGNGVVVAVKQSLDDVPGLVALREGREERLCHLGTMHSRLAKGGGKVFWLETVPGPRHTQENYTVVKSFDMQTHSQETITPRSRYTSISADEEGREAALISFSPRGECRLALLDLRTGVEKQSFAAPQGVTLKEAALGTQSPQGKVVAAVAITQGGSEIILLDITSGRWSTLLAPVAANITAPRIHEDTVFFESGASGTNNIYALSLDGSSPKRLTRARFGAFDPEPSPSGNLLYSDYHATGYRIASLSIDSLKEESGDLLSPFVHPLAETLKDQEGFNTDTALLPETTFNPRPYHKASHLFRIHSWAPFYYDVTEAMQSSADDFSTVVKPGAMLLSQNALGTAVTQAGWYYTHGEHHGRLSFTYQGWFPVIDITADLGGKAYGVGMSADGETGHLTAQTDITDRSHLEAEARVYVPLNLSRGHRRRGIQPSVTYHFSNDRYQPLPEMGYRNYQYLLPEVQVYDYRKMATRDIIPRWGYRLRLRSLLPLSSGGSFGGLYAARLTAYIPGILKGHGLMLRGAYQYQSLEGKSYYLPSHLIDTPRGFSTIYLTRQQAVLKADYVFPICMPDCSIGAFAYIRRLRGGVFYDLGINQLSRSSGWQTRNSAGLDVLMDWNALRLNFPLTLGIRMARPLDESSMQAEGIFSVTF